MFHLFDGNNSPVILQLISLFCRLDVISLCHYVNENFFNVLSYGKIFIKLYNFKTIFEKILFKQCT